MKVIKTLLIESFLQVFIIDTTTINAKNMFWPILFSFPKSFSEPLILSNKYFKWISIWEISNFQLSKVWNLFNKQCEYFNVLVSEQERDLINPLFSNFVQINWFKETYWSTDIHNQMIKQNEIQYFINFLFFSLSSLNPVNNLDYFWETLSDFQLDEKIRDFVFNYILWLRKLDSITLSQFFIEEESIDIIKELILFTDEFVSKSSFRFILYFWELISLISKTKDYKIRYLLLFIILEWLLLEDTKKEEILIQLRNKIPLCMKMSYNLDSRFTLTSHMILSNYKLSEKISTLYDIRSHLAHWNINNINSIIDKYVKRFLPPTIKMNEKSFEMNPLSMPCTELQRIVSTLCMLYIFNSDFIDIHVKNMKNKKSSHP